MKLIIDISEEDFNEAKMLLIEGVSNNIEYAVANGKPYEETPKGECEKCTYRIFTEKFADSIAEVMTQYGITSIEELQARLQEEMRGGENEKVDK